MDVKHKLESEIELLTDEIKTHPEDSALYMERAKLFHQIGAFDRALNDFIRVTTMEPKNKEAAQYATMIKEIFEYRYTDIYNP